MFRQAKARAIRHLVTEQAAPALLARWQAGRLLRQVLLEPGWAAAGIMDHPEFARRSGLP